MFTYSNAAVAATMLLGAITAGAQLTPSSRSYTPGRYGMELTAPTSTQLYIQSVAGGEMASDVVVADVGPDNIAKKHLPNVKFTPITVRGTAPELLTAFRAALDQPALAFDGRLVSLDFNYKVQAQQSFTRAQISQIVLSALDASSKEPATAEITLAPEQVRYSTGGDASFGSGTMTKLAKAPVAVGFQLQMPGLDDAMSHVTRVESIRMMQTLMPSSIEYARSAPGRWQNGNIVLTLPLAHAAELSKWRQQLLTGQSATLDKTLDLHLFAGTNQLLVLHASGVSLVSMREVKAASNDQSLVQAELIVQHWDVVPASTTVLR